MTKKFINDGFNWICVQCRRSNLPGDSSLVTVPRLLVEGESESDQQDLSTTNIARWLNLEERILVCPKCKIQGVAE